MERGASGPGSKTFMHHIQQVEKKFWEERFSAYASWKRKWVTQYEQNGWMQMFTGFVCQGFLEKNEIINYPIQGSAFHCLLWSLIELQRIIKKRGLKTLIVGQIHDSIVMDVPEEEMSEVVDLVHQIMVKRLCRTWGWICVPIAIEVEAAAVDRPWVEKVKI
jgi:DNA polymerase I-like protein with 3'-5' exonuclease and polymerase domains